MSCQRTFRLTPTDSIGGGTTRSTVDSTVAYVDCAAGADSRRSFGPLSKARPGHDQEGSPRRARELAAPITLTPILDSDGRERGLGVCCVQTRGTTQPRAARTIIDEEASWKAPSVDHDSHDAVRCSFWSESESRRVVPTRKGGTPATARDACGASGKHRAVERLPAISAPRLRRVGPGVSRPARHLGGVIAERRRGLSRGGR